MSVRLAYSTETGKPSATEHAAILARAAAAARKVVPNSRREEPVRCERDYMGGVCMSILNDDGTCPDAHLHDWSTGLDYSGFPLAA